ncbi:MAG: M48 family metalloprotease [Methanobacteriota archaeon]
MGLDAWGFDEARQALARRLRARRRRLSVFRSIALLGLLVVLLLGGSSTVQAWTERLVPPGWARAAVFIAILYAAGSALNLPFAYVGAFRYEVDAGLSTRTVGSWLADHGKAFGVGLVATVVAGNVVLWLLAGLPAWWWLAAWALGVVFGFLIGVIAPVVLVPLFFRSRPVRDEGLRLRIEALARKAGVPIVGVYELGAAAKTRRANAGVMGHGRTRRIVVTDTLLTDFAPAEVDAVLAHELGHEKARDPAAGFAYTAASSLVVAAIVGLLYAATFRTFGLASFAEPTALPVLAFLGSLVSSATGPLDLRLSRRREARADRFALAVTRDPDAFASMIVRIHDNNLGVAHANPWEVWLFYSHPPGRARVELARSFVASR